MEVLLLLLKFMIHPLSDGSNESCPFTASVFGEHQIKGIRRQIWAKVKAKLRRYEFNETEYIPFKASKLKTEKEENEQGYVAKMRNSNANRRSDTSDKRDLLKRLKTAGFKQRLSDLVSKLTWNFLDHEIMELRVKSVK